MTKTMRVDTDDAMFEFVDSLIASGSYNNRSEVIKEGLLLLQKRQTEDAKLEVLRLLIDEGEASGEPVIWDKDKFLNRMNNKYQV